MADKIKEVLKNDKFAIKAHVKVNGSDQHSLAPEWKVEQGASLVRIKAAGMWCEVETLDVGSVVLSATVTDHLKHPVATSYSFNIVDPEEKKATISVEVFPSMKEKAKKAADEKKAEDEKKAKEKAAHDHKVAEEKKVEAKKADHKDKK